MTRHQWTTTPTTIIFNMEATIQISHHQPERFNHEGKRGLRRKDNGW